MWKTHKPVTPTIAKSGKSCSSSLMQSDNFPHHCAHCLLIVCLWCPACCLWLSSLCNHAQQVPYIKQLFGSWLCQMSPVWFIPLCLSVVQWDVAWYLPHPPSTTTTTTRTSTPSAHLCSLETGRQRGRQGVSGPDRLRDVCVFGVGGREVSLLDEGRGFLEPNLLIDGLGWVGQGSLRGGVCGWRLPSAVCRPIDPLLRGGQSSPNANTRS